MAGYGGFGFRGSPTALERSRNAFRWGFGAGFPSRGPLRVTGELHGELPFDDTVTLTAPLVASDGEHRAAARRRSTASRRPRSA